MKGFLAVVLLLGLPSTALAQPALATSGDADAAQAEVDRDYAQALGGDCSLACRALDSMRRATERLCALDPGDRCAGARKKLDDATAHVRSACPVCAQPLEEQKPVATPPPPPTPAPASESAVQLESVHEKGGCAGCAAASTSADAAVPLVLAGLLVLASRRRRR